ncbi:hypothetical protein AGM16_0022 [Brevibacterium phage AGM16]|uniref:Uncharacterized protein n=1 Tax=Brevibacterium phage AGM16 TaxID=2591418 RepID=A0A7D0GIL7_9CAUD|nr:hypothetical protein AGM16_0022 [Brevibacterium phage AGM16]
MDRTSRILRTLGSVVFTADGGFYILAPPTTTTSFFDTPVPAIMWGWVFAAGGIVSLIGTLTRIVHVERLGVLFVIVAAAMLVAGQSMVMFGDPITWARGGGTLVYAGFGLWAFERWRKLGRDERAINEIADRG